MTQKKGVKISWLFLMAWRDSRRNRSRLFLFVSSIVFGIAALVSIYSLGENMRQEIDKQAAALLGADLEISNNKLMSPAIKGLIDSLGDRKSEERSFASMVVFSKSGGTRLVQIRALGGDFPYYGELETAPVGAGRTFRKGQQAVVDQTLMMQFNAQVGDTVKVGNSSFVIAGSLLGAPGQTGLSASIAPAVYIPLRYLEGTGLLEKGSRITYKYFFKYDKPVDIEQLVKTIEPRLEEEGVNYDTIESQKQDVNRSFSDLNRFLALIAFIALLLGCIGVASAVHIYIREKINTIAILRCLGTKAKEAFLIYLLQILGIGFIGSVIGAVLGSLIQPLLPIILQDFLSINMSTSFSWTAILQGIGLGLIISFLFALLPLVGIRKISPLNTLRLSYQPHSGLKDPIKWLVNVAILLFIFGFSFLQLKSWKEALFFTLGLVLFFLVLVAMAFLLMWAVRRFFPVSWNYLWRQGLANLYRPNNQTTILVVSIGLGTALLCTLFFVQSILLNRVSLSAGVHQPNTVLFDIQPAQKEKVINLVRQQGLPINGMVPIVNMRLESVNNITGAMLQQDSTIEMQRWIFTREYRVTFRDSLSVSEKITKGKWVGTTDRVNGNVYISVEERFAKRNNIDVGDTMVFNVQGSMIPTIVGSLREVDWNRVQTNFLVVFPTGVLEDAPQFHVLMTRVPSTEASARFQQAVVKSFPNVSIIDLGLVLSVLDDILSRIGFVIRFMAGFSMITGLVVLLGSILISKFQRIQESVLLRTLGASRKQVLAITALEYFFLGALSAATGIGLALAGSWALARFSFETSFHPPLFPTLVVFIAICLLTISIGLLNCRGLLKRPPLEILRQEV